MLCPFKFDGKTTNNNLNEIILVILTDDAWQHLSRESIVFALLGDGHVPAPAHVPAVLLLLLLVEDLAVGLVLALGAVRVAVAAGRRGQRLAVVAGEVEL